MNTNKKGEKELSKTDSCEIKSPRSTIILEGQEKWKCKLHHSVNMIQW